MDPSFLVDGVLRSVVGGRRKHSKRALRYLRRGGGGIGSSVMSHPTAWLTAAGVAWGIVETLQNQDQSSGQWGGGAPGPAGAAGSGGAMGIAGSGPSGPLPPLPNVAASGQPVDDPTRMVQLAISAAHADGVIADDERAAILQQAQSAGVGEVVEAELQSRRPLAQIVTGVTDPAQKATLYVLAYTILRADEQVSGAERIYLAQLAHLLGLDPATVQRLEQETAVRIDAQGMGDAQ